MKQKNSCLICENVSYSCEYCKKPCCTPCSNYDPDLEEETEFPKGKNGGIRNHPECILKAMNTRKQMRTNVNRNIEKEMHAELLRMQALQHSVEAIVKIAIKVAAHPLHRMMVKHGLRNKGDGNCALESANDNYNLREAVKIKIWFEFFPDSGLLCL